MLNKILSRLYPVLAAGLLQLAPAGGATAADVTGVKDLLDLPARANARASHSLQLALASAGSRLVAVGVRGAVLLSDDQGRSWRQATSVPVSVALTDVHFGSATHGWAVGHSGVVLATTDGGEHWLRQLDGNQVAAIVLEDAKARLAEGVESAAREVRDAERLVADGPDKPLLGVRFADASRGYVVGAYGLALDTEDGGASWHSLMGRIPNPRGKHLYQVRIEGDEVLIAGEQGALFRSLDGGASFAELHTPYSGTFFGALALDRETLLAFGLRGNVWRSADGGANWTRIELDQAVTLTSGRVLADGSVVLADESGRLLRSTDGGASFAILPVNAGTGLTALTQTPDGALVLAGARGLARIEPRQLIAESK